MCSNSDPNRIRTQLLRPSGPHKVPPNRIRRASGAGSEEGSNRGRFRARNRLDSGSSLGLKTGSKPGHKTSLNFDEKSAQILMKKCSISARAQGSSFESASRGSKSRESGSQTGRFWLPNWTPNQAVWGQFGVPESSRNRGLSRVGPRSPN